MIPKYIIVFFFVVFVVLWKDD